jgi:hypothetical protein
MLKTYTKKQHDRLSEIFAATINILPFSDDTPQKQQDRINTITGEGWKAFSTCCKSYFPHIFNLPFCDDHREAFEEVEQNIGGITAVTGFRNFGKTMEFALAYSVWKIIKSEKYIIHNAANEKLVKKRTELLYNQFSKNRRLLHDFPELAIQEGDKQSFYLCNDTLIEGVGGDQDVRGNFHPRTGERPGLIINDDIDRRRNMGNADIGKRRMESITEEQKGAMDVQKITSIIWLGNLTYPSYAICQFEKLIENRIKADDKNARPNERKHLKWHSLILLRFPLEDKLGRSRWEEMYPTATLPELRRDYGYTGYLREMMGKAVIEGIKFKFEWFKTWKTLPRDIRRVWLYADPARGTKGCYKAIVAIAWNGITYYVLKIWIRQTKQTSFFKYYYDAFAELSAKYRVKFMAGMEANFKQDDIITAFDRWCDDEGLIRIGHRIKPIFNMGNKDLEIEQTEVPIETGKLQFPEGQDMETLTAQYLIFNPGQKTDKDGPDAIARCLNRFPHYGARKGVRVHGLNY